MYVPFFSKPEKVLRVVNLSPNESIIEKLTEMHPMRQITYASIVQVCMFGFMLLAFKIISLFTFLQI